MVNMEKSRNQFIDMIKGCAIILVIMGHSIQYGSGELWNNSGAFFDNFLFKLIYSFHMPLFMIISGYLFFYSVNKYSFLQNTGKRIITLLIPIMAWSFAYNIVNDLIAGKNIISISFVKQCIWYAIGSFWFLWALFYCSLIIAFVNRYCRDHFLAYFVILILTFIIPDSYNIYLYKYMYPYFVIGYMVNKYKEYIKRRKENYIIWILFAVCFCCMLLFYDEKTYIYVSKYRVLGHEAPFKMFFTNVFRFVIGLWGSILTIRFIRVVNENISPQISEKIELVGKNSLGIYIISDFLFPLVLSPLSAEFNGINYFVLLVETAFITILSFIFSTVIKKIPIINFFLFGGRK